MPPIPRFRTWIVVSLLVISVGAVAALMNERDPESAPAQAGGRQSTFQVKRQDFVRSVRLAGTVEAVQATTISVPRLAGQTVPSLVITRLIRPGTMVKAGDLIVEFDRQDQLKNALDRRVELNDLEQQIRKKEAEERANRTRDETEIQQAETALARAQLEMVKNEMLPRIQVEKNQQSLEEAEAKLKQLKTTFELKRNAAAADLRILQIRRDRADNAMRQAESNADKMSIASPIAGMAVLRSIWKSNNMAEVQEGEEVRSGMPIVDVVNPDTMRVRAKVNQADINDLRVGQLVRIGLDAYPDLFFDGAVVQISPLAARSVLSAKVRTFTAIIDVRGSHPKLMPDLTASLDVELAREPGALVVPRDALRKDGDRTVVRMQRGSSFEDQAVTVGSLSAHEAVVSSGLQEGAVIARNVTNVAARGASR
ncbi:MAG TPA: HlyD family efflux transporter periplasmic adaptor subunit [Vicinamibacterales bacterium]|nr:HlyD family efflux transporter periplasmic adaptor subunit [Vicinamibacterales bacterium]